MAGNGWQFSVTIPSWTQATLEGDENIVFYRVEVKVLPPEADAAPRTRSVLRRFSHFTKLYAKLKEELGNKKMAKLDPPSKNRLVGVNKRPDLVERRRRELESWLWKLIGDGEIARSRVLNNFLELSDAARLVQRVVPSAHPSRPPSQSGSHAWSEGGSSSMHEGSSSQQSGAAPSASDFYSSGLAKAQDGLDALPSVRPSLTALQRSASDSTPQLPGPPGPPSDHPPTPQPMARSASTSEGISVASIPPSYTHQQTDASQSMSRTTSTASEQPSHRQTFTSARIMSEAANMTQSEEPRMRLGLRVEQRVTVKHHVKALQQQLDQAAGDLQDAMEAIQTERHTKRQLAAQLTALQERASESGVMQAAEREAELASSLKQAHELSEQLQQEVTDAQAQLATAQTQLGDSKSAHAESQQQLSASQSSITSLQTQLDKLKQELTQSQQAAPAAAAAHQESDSAASSAAASMSLQLSDSQQHVSSLQQQLEQLRMQLEDSQQAAAQAESVYKDACAAAASYAHQQLVDSQQQVTLLQSERDQIRQQLLQLQETAAQAAAAQHSKDAGANATAVSSSLLDDAPTVAPPTNASAESQGQDPPMADSPHSLQADKAAAEERLGLLVAEMQAFRQQAADAESKSRADRKVLAREVKALRKQLDTEKQQAAAREAELAAREAEHAAGWQAERSAMTAERESWEAERAAAQARSDAARDAEPAAAAPATPAVAAAAKQDAPAQEVAGAADAAVAASSLPESDEAIEAAVQAKRITAADSEESPDTSTSAASAAAASAMSYQQLLQEVAALRLRLQDSSFEVVAGQSAAGYDIKPQAAMEMLATCDGRLQALMAEANLLGEAALLQGQEPAKDAELRQAFASLLIESGALRQQINTLLRDKYEVESCNKSMESQQAVGPDVKGLLRKLPGMPFLAAHSNGAAHPDEESAKPAFGDRFAGFGDRFSKSFSRPQQ